MTFFFFFYMFSLKQKLNGFILIYIHLKCFRSDLNFSKSGLANLFLHFINKLTINS